MDDGDRAGPELSQSVAAIVEALAAEEGPLTDKKRRIVEAAVLCFAEQGYEATATSAIARRAGVAEATIFRHFATKKDLLLRLVRPVANRLLLPAATEEMTALLDASGGRFDHFAKAIMASRLAFADRHAPLVRILFQELPLHPELRAIVLGGARSAFADLMPAAFARFHASGAVRDVPVRRALQWFGSAMLGFYIARSLGIADDWSDDAEIDATVEFLMHGLAGPESTPGDPGT